MNSMSGKKQSIPKELEGAGISITEDFEHRISALEDFQKEYIGEKFYEKICIAIDKSVPTQNKIKSLIWSAIKEKFLWFIGALIVLLGSNFIISFIREWAKKVAGN